MKLLYVVPIIPLERYFLVDHGRQAFLDYIKDEGVDILADRHDDPKWYKGTE